MEGKTVVVTGATSGIGEIAACALAQQGARIIFIARDPQRGDALLQRLTSLAPRAEHRMHRADLSQLAEMKRVGAEIARSESRIDVLINNAGAVFGSRELTVDGLERTFATNHLSYFVISNLLAARLRATPAARVVSTASGAHKGATLDWDDLQSQRHYRPFGAYSRSKLMNILFTRVLARRLADAHVTANCFHPGFVATRFGDSSTGLVSVVLKIAKRWALTPEEGARTLVYLASSPEVQESTGQYFYKCRPVAPSTAAQNDADAQKLWEISARLSGLPSDGGVDMSGQITTN